MDISNWKTASRAEIVYQATFSTAKTMVSAAMLIVGCSGPITITQLT